MKRIPYKFNLLDIRRRSNEIKFNEHKITIPSKKEETKDKKKEDLGATAKIMVLLDGKLGMIKFAKYLYSENVLDLGKKVVNGGVNEKLIFDELLGMNFSNFLGLYTSEMKPAFAIGSSQQIQEAQTGTIPEFYGQIPEVLPCVVPQFNQQAVPLLQAQVVAGSDTKQNQGHTRPWGEGNNANLSIGRRSYPKLKILAFITNDPDFMGKDVQNKLILPDGEILVIDTAVNDKNLITIREDGNFYSETYNHREKSQGNGRHNCFRNVSLIDDTPFMDMLEEVNNFYVLGTAQAMYNHFAVAEVELKSNKKLRQEADYDFINEIDFKVDILLDRPQELKPIVHKRLLHLREIFKPYRDIYKVDRGLAASIVALEELLSPSTMYSEEGVPLRAVKIPYEKHFFFHKRYMSKNPNVQIDEKNVTINLAQLDETHLKRFQEFFQTQEIKSYTCSMTEFKTFVTENRVRLITHPETVSLKTALLLDEKIDYLKDCKALISNIKQQNLKEILLKLISFYASEDKDTLKHPRILSLMIAKINEALPENLLDTRTIDHTQDYGKLVELRVKMLKQQQLLLSHNPFLLQAFGKDQLLDIFEKADALDITAAVNELLILGCKINALPNIKLEFQSWVNDVINNLVQKALKFPGSYTNFMDYREQINLLRKKIGNNIEFITQAISLPDHQAAPLETAEEKSIGIRSASSFRAKGNNHDAISAMTKVNIYSENSQPITILPEIPKNQELILLP